MNAYITHVNLPQKLLQHEHSIHFVSTSQHASAVEQFGPVHDIIQYVLIVLCEYHITYHIFQGDSKISNARPRRIDL